MYFINVRKTSLHAMYVFSFCFYNMKRNQLPLKKHLSITVIYSLRKWLHSEVFRAAKDHMVHGIRRVVNSLHSVHSQTNSTAVYFARASIFLC